jgi:hypothetical protein
MPDDVCIFLRTESEIVEDEDNPPLEIHYQIPRCLIIDGDMGKCPFPARICPYKVANEDPTVEGEGMKFSDGSVLNDLSEVK